ncbi:uncharacterized protein (DUF2141 family) [Pedobacter sp. UYEF25]
MKLILSLLFAVVVSTGYAQNAETNALKITITNIKKVKGTVELGIYNNPKVFLDKDKAFKNLSEKVTAGTVTFFINGLEKGDYAIALYQDVNSDHECNMNFLGIPVEPYGFSNNVRPKLSKPRFKECKISLNENKMITIKLVD